MRIEKGVSSTLENPFLGRTGFSISGTKRRKGIMEETRIFKLEVDCHQYYHFYLRHVHLHISDFHLSETNTLCKRKLRGGISHKVCTCRDSRDSDGALRPPPDRCPAPDLPHPNSHSAAISEQVIPLGTARYIFETMFLAPHCDAALTSASTRAFRNYVFCFPLTHCILRAAISVRNTTLQCLLYFWSRDYEQIA